MENLIEVLIPIIFFIIWTLSSISASKKKQQPAPPERGPHPFPEYPQESPPPSSTNPVEDLKRTLESIFSEMAGESPKTVEQKPSPKKPVQPAAEPAPVQISKTVARKKTSFDTSSSQEELSYRISHQELRNAIVLMEILSPPVSMRE